jgi:hypothetical protein
MAEKRVPKARLFKFLYNSYSQSYLQHINVQNSKLKFSSRTVITQNASMVSINSFHHYKTPTINLKHYLMVFDGRQLNNLPLNEPVVFPSLNFAQLLCQ